MGKLNKTIKEKPITAAILVAVIIGLFCLIIFVNKYYQPQLELPPKLVAVTADGKEVELFLFSYDWKYKGEEKVFNPNLDVNYLTTYNFNGENTLYDKYDMLLEKIEIKTEPKYKVKGFETKALRYQAFQDDYQSGNNFILSEKDKTKIDYYFDSCTNLVAVTLYSETQGRAVYGLKAINSFYINANKIKEMGSLNFDKDSVSNFLKDQTYGKYLNNVQIENNKLILTYDYYIEEAAMQMYTNSLFALIGNLEEIEYKFSYDKYVKTTSDPITYKTTYTDLDSIDPIVYSRNSFIDTNLDLSLEEFEAFLRK